MKITAITDTGCRKSVNEDTIILLDGQNPIYGVADGMGGHVGGSVASSKAAEALISSLRDKTPRPGKMREAFRLANACLIETQKADPSLMGMGTTMTVMWHHKDKAILGHVGDSRAYRLRDGVLTRLTNDHSVINEMITQGIITPQEAKVHPYRHVITRAVGTEPLLEIDVSVHDTLKGDKYLVCSDGLTEYLDDERIRAVLLNKSIEGAAETMLREVLSLGGLDNVTIVIAEVEHE